MPKTTLDKESRMCWKVGCSSSSSGQAALLSLNVAYEKVSFSAVRSNGRIVKRGDIARDVYRSVQACKSILGGSGSQEVHTNS